MLKVLIPFFSFLLFGVLTVKLYPKNHKLQSRSIASVGETIVTGELNAYYDEFDPNNKTIKYFIIDGSEEVEVQLEEDAIDLIGMEVQFQGNEKQGVKIGKVHSLNHSKRTHPFLDAAPQEIKFRDEKMLILFFKFDTSPRTFLNMQEAEEIANGAFKRFFNTISEGRIRHDITVSGWHHIGRDEQDGSTTIDCYVTNQEVKDAAASANLDLTEYTNITMISNCSSYFTIGGRATINPYDWLGIGKKSTYIKMSSKPEILKKGEHPFVPGWTSFTGILVHERGHNFKLLHSNALDCDDRKYLQGCEHIEYGNRFDRMGGPDGSYIFNADQQRKAGWKNENTDFIHIKETGEYTIDRLTTSGKNKKIGAYIYSPDGTRKAMMVEYRQPDGFDNNLSNWVFRNVWKGVHLYSTMGPSSADKSPRVSGQFRYIDSNPTSLDWHQDTAYESLDGEFFEPAHGIRITTTGIYGTKAHIYVEYDNQNQVCFKKELKDKIKRPFVTRYFPIGSLPAEPAVLEMQVKPKPIAPKPIRRRAIRSRRPSSVSKVNINNLRNSKDLKSAHIVLIPGDDFKIKYESLLADHLMCPRSSLRIEWLNGEDFFSWKKPTPIKPGGGFEPVPGGSSGGGGGKTIPPYGGGTTDTPSFNLQHNLENYDRVYSYIPELKVPEGTLGKNYLLRFKVNDTKTGESLNKNLYIHIRSSHDAIVPIELNQDR